MIIRPLWLLLHKLENYNNLSEECSAEERLEQAIEVINELNKELKSREITEEDIVRIWLKEKCDDSIDFVSFGYVAQVPKSVESHCSMDKREFLDNLDFYLSCRKIEKYLEKKNEG